MAEKKKIEQENEIPETPDEKAAPASPKVRFGLRLKFSLSVIALVTFVIATLTVYLLWR